jgi:hypothetical protein
MFASLLSISVLSVALAMEPRGQGRQQGNQQNPQGNQQNTNNNPNPILQEADENVDNTGSPARRINRQNPPPRDQEQNNGDIRTFNGTNNNQENSDFGASHTQLRRIVPTDYSDDISGITGDSRPSARAISNTVSDQADSIPNAQNASDFLWQWGQFVDHDIDLTDGVDPTESADIAVPVGDEFFDPSNTGTVSIPLNRSIYDVDSGTSSQNPRQQLNEISAWIDASNVYGSDTDRASALRTLDGSGTLKSSEGDFLPFNTDGLSNAGGDSSSLFLAGDVRANEQVGLTTMHTLFMREHNRLAALIAEDQPNLSGDEIYESARRIVGAEMQKITYREYLPALLGRNALRPYRGYRDNVDAGISNLFSTAAYRYGHSALSPTILRLNADGSESSFGNLALRDAFFSPQRLSTEGGIEPVLRGLAGQVCQAIDPFVIDDVRNFLFGQPGQGGFDLVALNIQRGRDHGLPSYNEARTALGLSAVSDFADISSNTTIQDRLRTAYGSVNNIDVWVGGLAEDTVNDGMVGELISTVLTQQFEALRDGDRFWYENSLSKAEQDLLGRSRLSDIIRRNTDISDEIDNNVFQVAR